MHNSGAPPHPEMKQQKRSLCTTLPSSLEDKTRQPELPRGDLQGGRIQIPAVAMWPAGRQVVRLAAILAIPPPSHRPTLPSLPGVVQGFGGPRMAAWLGRSSRDTCTLRLSSCVAMHWDQISRQHASR
jgi:hypothetical protein